MADSGVDRGSDRRPAATLRAEADRTAAEAAKFAELRALLVGPEQRQLLDLKTHLADRTARAVEVSGVLSEAIARSANDPNLARALTPPIEQAITASARRDPRPLADALFPVIGSTLRKFMGDLLTPLVTLGCAVILVAGVWTFQAIRERQRWDDYLSRLAGEPGLVVVQSGRRSGKFFVTGLRDDLAVDPATLVAGSGLAPEGIESRWEPYQSLHPPFVAERARTVLRTPDSVTLTYTDGVLTASGVAPHQWVSDSALIAPALAGVRKFEFVGSTVGATPAERTEAVPPPDPNQPVPPPPASASGSATPPRTAPPPQSRQAAAPPTSAGPPSTPPAPIPPGGAAPAATPPASKPSALGAPAVVQPLPGSPELKLIEQIEASTLYYATGQFEIGADQEVTVRRLTNLFRELNEVVHRRGLRARVDIVSYAVDIPDASANGVARVRMNTVLTLFRSHELDAVGFAGRTLMAAPSPEQALSPAAVERARRVSFRVRLLQPAAPG